MDKPEWTENYDCHKLQVGRLGSLNVNRSLIRGEGYRVTVFGHRIKVMYQNLDEAKAAAVAAGKRLLYETKLVFESLEGKHGT